MKKLIVVLMILLIAGMVFAVDQKIEINATMNGKTELKLTKDSPFNSVADFVGGNSLEAIEFGEISYGMDPAIGQLFLNLISNTGSTITINAIPQGPLAAEEIKTRIGYYLTTGDRKVAIDSNGNIEGETLQIFTKNHGMALLTQEFKLILFSSDVNLANAGNYSAIVTFDIVID